MQDSNLNEPSSSSPRYPDTQRRTCSRENYDSSLEIFTLAKRRIIDIFKDLLKNAKECKNIEREYDPNSEELPSIIEKIECIKARSVILERNHMKVVFLGRTSSGKSTVINAMLGANILPHSMGHTTSCFVQVEGTDSQEGYLYTEDNDRPQKIDVIEKLADDLDSECVQRNSHIRICFPKEKCRLLRENVVLVDSPGIEFNKDIDCWINEVCLDADVFVLVVNAESSLTQTEKRFFVELRNKTLKPNIFILQNKWDNLDVLSEKRAELVKEKNYQTAMHFLTEELKVTSKQKAEQRIFFVSAKEVGLLRARVTEEHTTPSTRCADDKLLKNYSERKCQFENFESRFETCISKTAVKTKLEQHGQMGKEIAKSFDEHFERTILRVSQKIDETKETSHMKKKRIEELESLITEIKRTIKMEKTILEEKVDGVLRDIIERVPEIISSFEGPRNFNADYKKRLDAYFEDCVNKILQEKCSLLLEEIQETVKLMKSKIALLLPANMHEELNNIMTDLDVMFDCGFYIRNSLDKFEGDLTFKILSKNNIPGAAGGISAGTAGALGARLLGPPILGAAIGVVPTLAASLPLAAVSIGGYFGYKTYEWNKTGKYEAYLQQYSDHAKKVLRLNVEKISHDFSKKVHEKLSQSHSDLQILVNKHGEDLTEKIKDLNKILENLKGGLHLKVMALREKLVEINKELEKFIKDYFPISETP